MSFSWIKERICRPRFRVKAAGATLCVGLWVAPGIAQAVETQLEPEAVRSDSLENVILAGSGAQLEEAVAAAGPGDTVILGNGVWRNQRLTLAGKGSNGKPIRVRAETPGEVLFTGDSSITLSGNDLVLEGLHFGDGYLNREGAVIELDGRRLRLAGTVIDSYNPPVRSSRYDWVVLRGQNHEVEACTFRGMDHIGAMLDVVRTGRSADHHYIRNNYFADRSPGSGEGWETIRIGGAVGAYSSSYTVVEGNLFEACDGGEELILNGSGGNTFRNNTFRGNQGALSLRHGQASLVEANFFLGEETAKSGAIWIHGRGHVVINNYIESVGDWNRAAISLGAGVPGAPAGSDEAAEGTVLAFNTIVDSLGPAIDLANGLKERGRTVAPSNISIGNNLFYATSYPDEFFFSGEAASIKMEGNIGFGREPGRELEEGQMKLVDPMMQRADDGLMRPAMASPTGSAAVGDYRMVARDIDGQRRSTMKDVGCDEVLRSPVENRPLTAEDVGAIWFRTTDDDSATGS